MKKYCIIIIFQLLGLTCFAQPMSGAYIVGGPQGDFATPSLAVQQLQQRGMSGPVTLKIYAGTYWEQIFIGNIPGNSYQNNLTIESESSSNDVIITFDMQNYSTAYLIMIGDMDHVIFKNITFVPTGLYPTCIKATGGNHIKLNVNGCIFNSLSCSCHTSSYSIAAKDFDTLWVSDNTFNGCQGLSIVNTSNAIIDNNSFYQNSNSIIACIGQIGPCKFANNTIFSDKEGRFILDRHNAIYSTIIAENNLIILKGKWISLFWIADQMAVFRNNIIIADSAAGIFSECGASLSMYNNTLKAKYTAIGYFENVNELKNNIFIATEGPLFHADISFSSVNSDNNVLYSPSNSPFCTFGDTNIAAIPDFAAWQNMGMDTHTKWGIPLFSKPYDLHLQPGDTLARSAGIPIASVTHDFDGDLRDPLHPDIGADEVVIRPVLDDHYNACIGSSFTLDAGAGFSTYQWSTGAVTQSITLPSSAGTASYTCTVTFGTFSGQKTTEVRWVDCTAITKHDKTGMVIRSYPNPASHSITLQASEGNDLPECILQIYSIQGIKHIEVPMQINLQKLEVDISSLPPGLFLGRIIGRNGESGVFRFVKSKG